MYELVIECVDDRLNYQIYDYESKFTIISADLWMRKCMNSRLILWVSLQIYDICNGYFKEPYDILTSQIIKTYNN